MVKKVVQVNGQPDHPCESQFQAINPFTQYYLQIKSCTQNVANHSLQWWCTARLMYKSQFSSVILNLWQLALELCPRLRFHASSRSIVSLTYTCWFCSEATTMFSSIESGVLSKSVCCSFAISRPLYERPPQTPEPETNQTKFSRGLWAALPTPPVQFG